VIQALLTYVTRLLDLDLDMAQFAEAIQDFRSQCDRAVARDPSTQAHVRQLEQDYDATFGEERPTLRDEALDAEKLMQELEDFLREERKGGEEG
jgi:predicted  nucleic acid-binding Zn-ribbon protein